MSGTDAEALASEGDRGESLGTWIRTAFCVVLLPIGLIGYSALAVVFSALRAHRWVDACYTQFAALCLWFSGSALHVRGLENLKPGQDYVIVANHESNYDPPGLLVALKGLRVRFVIKRQIMAIPVFGHALRATGNVLVERSNMAGDVARIRELMSERPPGVSMLFYAEGSRARDGRFGEFKKGAFATAIAYGLPVLPIGHAGAYRIWTPLLLRIRKVPMAIEIGRPIPVDGLDLRDRDKLRDRVHAEVRELRRIARDRLRQLGHDPGGRD